MSSNSGIAMRFPSFMGVPSAAAGRSRRLTSRLTHTVRRRLGLLILVGAIAIVVAGARPHLQAWYHLRAARAELQRYHNPQAIRHLRICRDTWPRDPDVSLLAARAARRAQVYGDADRLLRIYREARGRDETHTFEQLLLATECQVDQTADLCWSRMETKDADAPLLLEALTRGYLRQYRLGQARRCLERWRQLQPENPQIFYLEGVAQLDYLHAMSTAASCFRRAVELDPDHEEARLGLAVALLDGKSFARAAEQLQHLRQCQPDNLRIQVGLAECLEGQGQNTEAVELTDDVLARQPGYAPALALRGQLALKDGQWVEAENWLRQALRGDPTDHRARYGLLRCLEQSGQDEELRRERHQLQQMEDDLARFNEIVTQEIPQRPTDPALHCTLGQLLLRGGKRQEGLRWLQSALRIDPKYAPARQALTNYLSQANAKSQSDSP
ncbi:MAG TPA: tetratricopeptide repeat protein [Gemmataceae bacterium]|nr:tetratricopeptide repeat protein [Gemmataceae bacterium]